MGQIEIKHIKRSPGFQREIEVLADALMNMWVESGGGVNLSSRIIEILRNNTTDSKCMVNAKDDEPIFVLKAKDQTADKTVDFWCEEQIALAINARIAEPSLDAPQVPPKVADARVCAEEMRHYPGRKKAD